MNLIKKLKDSFPGSHKPLSTGAPHHLQYAVNSGDLDYARHWIKQGAKATKQMLYFAVGTKHYGMTELLLSQKLPATKDLMAEAYRQKNGDIMLLLEKYGATLDEKNADMKNFLKKYKKNLRLSQPKNLPSAPVYPAG